MQAVGHIPIDVKVMGIDMLSASAHKFNGPKGIGFLYSRNGLLQPFHNGGFQESGMRAGTENVPAIVGMAVALKKNVAEMEQQTAHLNRLTKIFLSVLHQYSDIATSRFLIHRELVLFPSSLQRSVFRAQLPRILQVH